MVICKHSFLRRKRLPGFGKGVNGCRLISIFLAELFGTGIFLYLGCMGAVNGDDYLRTSFAFGLAATTSIQCVFAVSSGHINPALSVAAVVMGKITAPLCFFYVAAQTCGALLGYGLLLLLTPDEMRSGRTCCTLPAPELSVLQALFCEFLATSVLVFLFCGCCDRRNDNKQDSTPIKFGLAVALLVAVAGPYTGGSLNPVRSLAPAIYHNNWTQHWIYSSGQMAASLVVPIFYRLVFTDRAADEAAANDSVVYQDVKNPQPFYPHDRITLEHALREALSKRQLNNANMNQGN